MSSLGQRAMARKSNAKLSIRERNEIRARRATGVTLSELSVDYDVSPQAILYHVRDIPPPPSGWKIGGARRTINYAKAAELRAKGMTLQAIGDRFGVSRVAVHIALRVSLRSSKTGGEG